MTIEQLKRIAESYAGDSDGIMPIHSSTVATLIKRVEGLNDALERVMDNIYTLDGCPYSSLAYEALKEFGKDKPL